MPIKVQMNFDMKQLPFYFVNPPYIMLVQLLLKSVDFSSPLFVAFEVA